MDIPLSSLLSDFVISLEPFASSELDLGCALGVLDAPFALEGNTSFSIVNGSIQTKIKAYCGRGSCSESEGSRGTNTQSHPVLTDQLDDFPSSSRIWKGFSIAMAQELLPEIIPVDDASLLQSGFLINSPSNLFHGFTLREIGEVR